MKNRVYIFDEFNDTTFFHFTGEIYTPTGFTPLPNTIYYLNVNDHENKLFATGQLTTPNIPQLHLDSLSDTLIINELFQLTKEFYVSTKDTGLFLLKNKHVGVFPKTSFVNYFRIESI